MYKEYSEGELQRVNDQYTRTIKDLESRCRYLEELSQPRSPISNSNDSIRKSVSFKNIRKKSKSRASKSNSPRSPRSVKPNNRHIGAHLIENGDFSDKINKKEAEIEELNKIYNKKLKASKSESSSIGRMSFEQISNELENKGKELNTLKRLQIQTYRG